MWRRDEANPGFAVPGGDAEVDGREIEQVEERRLDVGEPTNLADDLNVRCQTGRDRPAEGGRQRGSPEVRRRPERKPAEALDGGIALRASRRGNSGQGKSCRHDK